MKAWQATTAQGPCVVAREGGDEVSAGERIGQPWSLAQIRMPGTDVVEEAEGETGGCACELFERPGVA